MMLNIGITNYESTLCDINYLTNKNISKNDKINISEIHKEKEKQVVIKIIKITVKNRDNQSIPFLYIFICFPPE